MIEPRLILCSGAKLAPRDRRLKGRKVVRLNSLSSRANVNIHFEDVAKTFHKHLSPRLTDLVEIAAYVFSADCGTRRGKQWFNEGATESWDRDFTFVVPVRDYAFWNRQQVRQLLEELLGFLSDDTYKFNFRKLKSDRPNEPYLEFSDDDDWPFSGAERVLMFSGGLDSLAGAIDSAERGEHLVLVSHRSNTVLDSRQRKLVERLRERYPGKIIHIPVWLNKGSNLDREHTQRTRSFLYTALGVAVAESVRSDGVRFFENGIVSLNLPIADEVLRARASRTTHPHALALFEQLLTLVTDRDFKVDNPYLFKTKAEVVSILSAHRAEELIQHTCSCAHAGFFQSKTQWHCGACSQCIDRRIAVVAADVAAQDPEVDYVCDVFSGERCKRHEANTAVDFVRHAFELGRMSEVEMATRFNAELARATRDSPHRREAARELIDMHVRHATAVRSVLRGQIAANAERLADGELPPNCMLNLVVGQHEHLKTTWRRYCDRIADILNSGIPTICQKTKPKDEPHLQEMCDGLLRSHDLTLEREFPFLGWSSTKTKPDWSNEELRVWVELKYVRKKADIRQITEDIAADITKYGDNERRTLFVVYDPLHLVLDEAGFAAPIEARPEMMVRFIR